MRRYAVSLVSGITVGVLALAAGVRAGTPRATNVPPRPNTEAILTAQQAAIGGAYVATGKYPTRSVPSFPTPVAVEDTQSPGEEADPKNIPTPLVREWEIMGSSDDGSGLLAGSHESRLHRIVRFLLTFGLIGGAGFWVFRRAQKHLDATLRGWGLNID